ncbi:MAG: glycosyltransferase family 2 protein [bacterium]
MTKRPKISVVIVTYQSENHIAACLRSLLGELKNTDYQITIIDNHSFDGTRQRLNEFEENDAVYLLLNNQNLGFTRALNQGLATAEGEFILTLNPDTVLQPGCLQALVQSLRENPHVGVVAPQLLYADHSVQPSCRRFPKPRDILFNLTGLSNLFSKSRLFNGWKMGDFKHDSRRSVQQPQGAFLLFKRKILQDVGLWDESFPMFFSDVDWCKRVKEHGAEIVFEPVAKVIHSKGASVAMAPARMIWSSHRSFYRYFKKHQQGRRFLNEILGAVLVVSAFIRMAGTILVRMVAKVK